MVKFVQWRMCEMYGLGRMQKWGKHKLEGITENDEYKILRNFTIQCDSLIDAQRPDITVVDERKKEAKIIDITIPGDMCVGNKVLQKMEKYKLLKNKIVRCRQWRE